MCEFPEKKVDTYLAKLVRCGKSVALCGVDDAEPQEKNPEFVVRRIFNYPQFCCHPARGED